jgi:hypothetical protein
MSIDFRIRALVPLKIAGKDWLASATLTYRSLALSGYLNQKTENWLERHSLLEALERRGINRYLFE